MTDIASDPSPVEPGPSALLLIHREEVPQIHTQEFGAIEAGIARSCLELGCPHPYLGLQTISGEHEVWFLNGFASVAEQEDVGRRYLANSPLMSALAAPSRRKAALVKVLGEHLASYRFEQGAGTPWSLGRDPYLVIAMGREAMPAGAAYEAPDGTWFTLEGAPDAQTAVTRSQRCRGAARALAVRPDWSCPSTDWARRYPELWSAPRIDE